MRSVQSQTMSFCRCSANGVFLRTRKVVVVVVVVVVAVVVVVVVVVAALKQ